MSAAAQNRNYFARLDFHERLCMKKLISYVLLGVLLVSLTVFGQKPAPAQASSCEPRIFILLLPDGPHVFTITVCNLN
jgi:hypothetical protein